MVQSLQTRRGVATRTLRLVASLVCLQQRTLTTFFDAIPARPPRDTAVGDPRRFRPAAHNPPNRGVRHMSMDPTHTPPPHPPPPPPLWQQSPQQPHTRHHDYTVRGHDCATHKPSQGLTSSTRHEHSTNPRTGRWIARRGTHSLAASSHQLGRLHAGGTACYPTPASTHSVSSMVCAGVFVSLSIRRQNHWHVLHVVAAAGAHVCRALGKMAYSSNTPTAGEWCGNVVWPTRVQLGATSSERDI